MKHPLRIVCALFCALTYCAGQIPAAAQKIPAAPAPADPAQPSVQEDESGVKPPEIKAAAPPDVKPPAARPADPNAVKSPDLAAVPAEPGEVKPGCDADPTAVAESPSAKPYVIGTLDMLDIRVWNSANLSGMYDVQPDGLISVPLIGQIKADGVTVSSLTREIQSRLAKTVFECPPPVNVQVVRVNSKRFFMYGGIFRQGEYPLASETTVMDALANCGGFKDFAKPSKITIQRGKQTFKFNYNEMRKGKNLSQNITLQNGDRIFIPE